MCHLSLVSLTRVSWIRCFLSVRIKGYPSSTTCVCGNDKVLSFSTVLLHHRFALFPPSHTHPTLNFHANAFFKLNINKTFVTLHLLSTSNPKRKVPHNTTTTFVQNISFFFLFTFLSSSSFTSLPFAIIAT
ncbi:hypothetical protein VNO80_28894 [Phaseolus coccineus]|uniref:Uncharacterized protein n=1 Tax=Phaseolus coccineus TaxID=3886 RepID=A0AAN9LAF1_PHACN